MSLCVTLLLGSLLVGAAHMMGIPDTGASTPCCVPDTMTLHDDMLGVTSGHVYEYHITHYVDLGQNDRYAAKYVNKDPRASPRELDVVYFNHNHTIYNFYPSDQICQEITEIPPLTNCILKHTNFNGSATVGEGTPVNIFTKLHDRNMMDSFVVTPNLCVPVASRMMVADDDPNSPTILKSSYYNMTQGSPDSSIFQLPEYCFKTGGESAGEDFARHLQPRSLFML